MNYTTCSYYLATKLSEIIDIEYAQEDTYFNDMLPRAHRWHCHNLITVGVWEWIMARRDNLVCAVLMICDSIVDLN